MTGPHAIRGAYRRDGARERVGYPSLVLVGLVLTACQGRDLRVAPETTLEGGREVATIAALPNALDSDYRWSYHVLREVPTVKAGAADVLLYEPAHLLPLVNGDLLVFDPTAERPLVIVDPDLGEASARFGRSGRGPGELGGTLTFAEDAVGILVLDLENRQLHRFSEDGTPQSSSYFQMERGAGKARVTSDGTGFLVEGFRSSDDRWYRLLERVEIATGRVSEVGRLPTPTPGAEPGRIQQGRVIWTTLGRQTVAMWSATPAVFVYSDRGGVERELRLPLTQRRITEGDIAHQIGLYGPVAAGQSPGLTSLTNELYAVDDTIFAMLLSNNRRAAEDPSLPDSEIWWRMFTTRGEYVGVLRPPGTFEDFRVLHSGQGTVWARVLDDDGLPLLQELELVRSDGARIPSS